MSFINKCLFIEKNRKKILVIGDLHLGYENTLSAVGVFVNRFLLEETLSDLNKIFKKTGNVDEIILLGDIKHNFGSILKQEWEEVHKIAEFLKERAKKVVFLKGNHDNMTKIMGERIGFSVFDYYIIDKIAFIHGDRDFREIWYKEIRLIVIGYMHPAVEISDKIKREKYKCFLRGKFNEKEMVVLPSFTAASKGSDPRDFENIPWKINFNKFRVNIIDDNGKVYEFGKLKNIS